MASGAGGRLLMLLCGRIVLQIDLLIYYAPAGFLGML
jgi:hypothetical protein